MSAFPSGKNRPQWWAWVTMLTLACLAPRVRAQDDVAKLGPFPAQAMSWTDADKEAQRQAGAKLLQDLKAALASGAKTFVIPQGDYRFVQATGGSQAFPIFFELRNVKDLTIDGSGSTFWFEQYCTAFLLNSCQNVTLKNLYLDYDPLPFVQGRIVAIHPDSDQVDVEMEEGYDNVARVFAAHPPRESLRAVVVDPQTREFKGRQSNMSVAPFWDNLIAPRTYRVKVYIFHGTAITQMPWQVGDPFVIWFREPRGVVIRMGASGDILLEDVTLYASPGLALVEHGNTGLVTHRRVNILRRPGTDRLISDNADGFHFAGCLQGPVVEQCRIDHNTDDFVNSHDRYGHVWTQENPTTVLADPFNQPAPTMVGLSVDFYAVENFRFLGRRKVISCQRLSWTMQKSKMLITKPFNFRSGGLKDYVEGNQIPQYRLVLDQPLELPQNTVVCSPDLACPGTIIRDCDFHGSLARGILLKAPRSQVLNNHISYATAAGISLRCEISYWREGVLPDDCLVQGNTLDHNGWFRGENDPNAAILVYTPGLDFSTPSDPSGWVSGVHILNNTIQDSQGEAIRAMKVRNLFITGNTITRYNLYPAYEQGPHSNNVDKGLFTGMDYGIVLDHVRNLTMHGNALSQPGPASRGEYFQREVSRAP